jgi:transposase-like protein
MPRCSKQFKKEALALLESSGQSVNAVSKQLGISDKSLAQGRRKLSWRIGCKARMSGRS